jgi:small subunit ribosomal protein S11
MAGKKNVKKKVRKAVSHGKCFVQAGFGNTIITMTDLTGETIAWSSSGHLGFKGWSSISRHLPQGPGCRT